MLRTIAPHTLWMAQRIQEHTSQRYHGYRLRPTADGVEVIASCGNLIDTLPTREAAESFVDSLRAI